jgi:hypothetical protein
MESLRRFLKSPAGMGVAAVLVVVALVMAVQSLRGFVTSEAAAISKERVFIDAKTGKPYDIELKPGIPMPAPAPSGGNTGYPAEACYWTKDGKGKEEPTYVLLNSFKGSKDPTFCPDCGRLVVGHNPRPGEGINPPPTKEEYSKSPRGSGSRRQ